VKGPEVDGHPAGSRWNGDTRSRREVLAERLKAAWFEGGYNGRPIGDGWLFVADVALADKAEEEAPTPWDEPVPETDPAGVEPTRDHVYSINVIYPDSSEAFERGHATAGELAQRLRFEANLCSPERGETGHALPSPDEFIDGAPAWLLPVSLTGQLRGRLTAWNNGVQAPDGELIEDMDALELAARQILAAVTQVRGWRHL
jgi:hypothetical protein